MISPTGRRARRCPGSAAAPRPRGRPRPPPGGRSPLIPRAARRPGAILGPASFGYGTVNAFALPAAGTLALAVFAAAFLAVRLAGSRLVDDLGPRTVILLSTTLEAIALAGVATGTGSVAALALAGASVALVFPALAVWVVEAAPERERGAAVGAMTSCWDAGIAAAAGPAGAVLVTHANLAPAFLLAAALAALGALTTAARPRARELGRSLI